MNTTKRGFDKYSYAVIGLTFYITFFCFTNVSAQNHKYDATTDVTLDPAYTPPPPDSIRLFYHLDTMPKFRENTTKYIHDSIRYPEEAKEKKIQGTVFIEAIVERDGSISHVKVIRSADTILNQEAIRVISTMPKWIPGQHNGKPVKAQILVPVRFNLLSASRDAMKK